MLHILFAAERREKGHKFVLKLPAIQRGESFSHKGGRKESKSMLLHLETRRGGE